MEKCTYIIEEWSEKMYSFETFEDITSINWRIPYFNRTVLSNFPNLKTLSVKTKYMESFAGLLKINSLTELKCFKCSSIKGFERFPKKLINLKKFIFINNDNIQSLEHLPHLPSLELLNLSCCRNLEKFSYPNLKNLTSLDCSFTKIENFTNVESLDKLKYLNLEYSQIKDWKVFPDLPELEELYISRTCIRSFDNMKPMPKLKILSCCNNKIKSCVNLIYLPSLIKLDVCGNNISNYEGLYSSETLEILLLGDNELVSFTGLQNYPNLKELSVATNKFKNFKDLPSFEKLESLDIHENNLENFDYCPKFNNLKKINYSVNNITGFEGYPFDINVIEIIECRSNNICTLEGFPESKSLKQLNCSYNKLKNIKGIPYLPKLKYLFAWPSVETYINLLLCPTGSYFVTELHSSESQYSEIVRWLKKVKNIKYLKFKTNQMKCWDSIYFENDLLELINLLNLKNIINYKNSHKVECEILSKLLSLAKNKESFYCSELDEIKHKLSFGNEVKNLLELLNPKNSSKFNQTEYNNSLKNLFEKLLGLSIHEKKYKIEQNILAENINDIKIFSKDTKNMLIDYSNSKLYCSNWLREHNSKIPRFGRVFSIFLKYILNSQNKDKFLYLLNRFAEFNKYINIDNLLNMIFELLHGKLYEIGDPKFSYASTLLVFDETKHIKNIDKLLNRLYADKNDIGDFYMYTRHQLHELGYSDSELQKWLDMNL